MKTKRLILRQPEKKDINDLVFALNDLEVSKWVSKIPFPYTKKEALWWINHCKKTVNEKDKKEYNFNIELKKEKKILGGIGIFDINNFNQTCEIGVWIAQDYWRQGFVSEATKKIIDFAFKKLKLRRIVWKAYTSNKASNIVAKKLGFNFEGKMLKATKCLATGIIHDVNCYALLKQ
jgi:[ribosomal protein S5]-alanine N-acetyltransferase